MPLIIEDGSGKPDAESYVSASECDAYATSYGQKFAGDVAIKEAALRRATAYMDAKYTFKGNRLTSTQALSWPRTVVSGIPREIKAACCELAVRAIAGDLWRDVDPTERGRVIEKTVDVITTKYAAPSANGATQTDYAGVTALLRRWTCGGGSTVKLVRA